MVAKRTITRDLVLSIVTVVVLISAAVAALNYRIMSEKARVELETTADEYLSYLVSSLELPIWAIDNAAVLSIAESYGKNEQVAQLKISVTFNNATVFNMVKEEASGLVTRTGDIAHEGQVIGQVALGLTSKFYKRTIEQLLVTTVLTTFLISISLTGLTLFFSRMFLQRPFNNVIEGIEQISEGNYNYSFSQVRHREMQTVISKFIAMANRIKNREKSLQESEYRFRSFVDQAADAFFLFEEDGGIVDVNRQACESLGYTRAELLDMHLEDIVVSGSGGDYAALAGGDRQPGMHVTAVSDHRRQNGTIFPVEVRAGFLKLGQKKLSSAWPGILRTEKRPRMRCGA